MSEKQSPFSLDSQDKYRPFHQKEPPKAIYSTKYIFEIIKAAQKTVPKYETLCKNISKYAIENWTFSQSEERFVLNYLESEYYLSKFELCVENPLEFTILVYAFLLPAYFIYKQSNCK